MHVEDRLRQGLQANATSFVPEGEWRLAQVHRRRRQRAVTVLVAACAAAVVLVVGLLGGGGSRLRMLPGPAQPSPDAGEVSRGDDGTGLPDATWSRVATGAQAASLGIPAAAVARHLGDDGRLPLTLTLLDGTWAITTTADDGQVEVGDFGTAAYDERGDLVTTSSSSSCPGCRAVLRWRLAADDLVLGWADGPADPVERLVVEGTWHDRRDLASTSGLAGGCSSTHALPRDEEDAMNQRLDRSTVAALAVLGTLLTACSDDTTDGSAEAAAGDDPSATGTTPTAAQRLPESGWVRRTTAARAQRLGLPARTIERYAGDDGVLPLGFKLEQQTYAIYVIDDAGEGHTHDVGSYDYDGDGHLVLTSSGSTCDGCAMRLAWTEDGDRLVFHQVSGQDATPVERWLWQGEWRNDE